MMPLPEDFEPCESCHAKAVKKRAEREENKHKQLVASAAAKVDRAMVAYLRALCEKEGMVYHSSYGFDRKQAYVSDKHSIEFQIGPYGALFVIPTFDGFCKQVVAEDMSRDELRRIVHRMAHPEKWVSKQKK